MISSPLNAGSFSPFAALIVLLIMAFFLVVGLLPYWKIFGRTGFSPWLSVCMVIPLLNLVVLYYVAFAEWPIDRSRKVGIPPLPPYSPQSSYPTQPPGSYRG